MESRKQKQNRWHQENADTVEKNASKAFTLDRMTPVEKNATIISLKRLNISVSLRSHMMDINKRIQISKKLVAFFPLKVHLRIARQRYTFYFHFDFQCPVSSNWNYNREKGWHLFEFTCSVFVDEICSTQHWLSTWEVIIFVQEVGKQDPWVLCPCIYTSPNLKKSIDIG